VGATSDASPSTKAANSKHYLLLTLDPHSVTAAAINNSWKRYEQLLLQQTQQQHQQH